MTTEDPKYTELQSQEPEDNIYAVLKKLGIAYDQYDHPAVVTIKDLEEIDRTIPATRCKNLFLRDAQKGKRQYLVVADKDTAIDLSALAIQLGETKLSFGSPDRLKRVLGITPGAVSPFALLNDTSHSVSVIIDQSILQKDRLSFHPNVNTSTVVISTPDLQKFLGLTGNPVRVLHF